MPWCVTQSMASSASRRSSDSRRTVCTPGTTIVPLPVTIRKPRLSDTPSGTARSRRPEMISASFGSATRHVSLNSTKSTDERGNDGPADDEEHVHGTTIFLALTWG